MKGKVGWCLTGEVKFTGSRDYNEQFKLNLQLGNQNTQEYISSKPELNMVHILQYVLVICTQYNTVTCTQGYLQRKDFYNDLKLRSWSLSFALNIVFKWVTQGFLNIVFKVTQGLLNIVFKWVTQGFLNNVFF